MAALVKVPIARTSPPQFVTMERGATVGATVGVNLFWPDGSKVTADQLTGASAVTPDDPNSGNSFTAWSFLQEVPLTVSALEQASGTGLFAITGAGTGALRSLAVTAGELAVSNGDGVAGNPTFGLADLTDAGGGSLVKVARDAKGRIAGTSAATTSDLTEGARLYYTDARADARIAAAKADANGVASLVGGKLDTGQLPALAITDTFVVASEAAMLALTCQQGDVAVRTDVNKSFILTTSDPTVLANWQELLLPTGTMTSFNGRTGAVVPASGDYTAAQVGAEPTIAGGTSAQFWQGDKTWQDFATAVRAAALTGLSTATSAVIAATDTVLGALGKLQAQITENLLPKGYIDGLQMVWVSGTAVTVKSGAAYIEGSSKVLRATADIAKTGLSLTASAWYHVYLYSNAGTPDVEIVTTAPASPYNGTARSKTGDSSRRYVGSVRTLSGGAVAKFAQSGTRISYLENIQSDVFGLVNAGTATTATTLDCSGATPVTARWVSLSAFNFVGTTDNIVCWLGNADCNFALGGGGNFLEIVGPGGSFGADVPMASARSIQYMRNASGAGGVNISAVGYLFER